MISGNKMFQGMQLELSQADLDAFGIETSRELWAIQSDVNLAMADAYAKLVDSNFGAVGVARSETWPPLSPKYADKVGRSYATLEVSGLLRSVVRVDNSDLEQSTVSVSKDECVYALIHQVGGWTGRGLRSYIPARPYFPMYENGMPTDIAEREVIQAARTALAEALS